VVRRFRWVDGHADIWRVFDDGPTLAAVVGGLAEPWASLGEGDRVLLVDDWAEFGSQAVTARSLIESCGAAFLGLSVVVDQLPDDVRARLGCVRSIARHEDLV